jgi:hypothetical protein
MPYEGDSPFEAWEYWFDNPPSESVHSALTQCAKTHSAPDMIEAIRVAGMKFPMLENDEQRLRYMMGVLRRTALERIAPELAEEERQLDSICKYWEKKGISEWPLYRNRVRGWLRYVDPEGIKAVIHISRGWRDFHSQMDEIIANTPKYQHEQAEAEAKAQVEAAAEAARELTVVPRRRRRRKS